MPDLSCLERWGTGREGILNIDDFLKLCSEEVDLNKWVAAPSTLSMPYVLQYSSQASGKGLEVEQTHRETEQTHGPLIIGTKPFL